MLEKADPAVVGELLPNVVNDKVGRCQSGIDRRETALADTHPDVMVIIGDDQHKQFLENNQPAVLICSGETIENGVLPLPATAPECRKKARSQYHEVEQPREYPVASGLVRQLTQSLVTAGFDISHSEKLPRLTDEGHAYGFVHHRLMIGYTDPSCR